MTAAVAASSWDYWELGHKVTFDPVLKLITVAPSVDRIDVQVDLYSDSKEWLRLRNNLAYRPPVRAVGGDYDPSTGSQLGTTYFLTNGWRILLDHGVTFVGNLKSDDYPSPFLAEPGVEIATTVVSTLVEKPDTAGIAAEVDAELQDDFAAVPPNVRAELRPDFDAIPTATENAQAVRSELSPELAEVSDSNARIRLIEKVLRNKMVTDPTTGTITIYDDDGATVLLRANLYEDKDATQPYRGQGADRRERLA